MIASAARSDIRSTPLRSLAGIVIGAMVALLLSEGLVAASALIAELQARSHSGHILISPRDQIGFAWWVIGPAVVVVAAGCAPIWLALHLMRKTSQHVAVVLGLLATAAAWGGFGGYRGDLGMFDIGLPLIGALSGWVTWRVSYSQRHLKWLVFD